MATRQVNNVLHTSYKLEEIAEWPDELISEVLETDRVWQSYAWMYR